MKINEYVYENNTIKCFKYNKRICEIEFTRNRFEINLLDIQFTLQTKKTKEIKEYLEEYFLPRFSIILSKEIYDILETMEVIWKLTK